MKYIVFVCMFLLGIISQRAIAMTVLFIVTIPTA